MAQSVAIITSYYNKLGLSCPHISKEVLYPCHYLDIRIKFNIYPKLWTFLNSFDDFAIPKQMIFSFASPPSDNSPL